MHPILSLLLFSSLVIPTADAAKLPTADEARAILLASDQARGGLAKGLVWEIQIATLEGGSKTDRSFLVKAKGDDAAIEATAPSRSKGEVFLFNDRTMWFFKPGLRKPLAISARQRLSGQAANGDIASTHYARDYEGKIVREEKVGAENAYVFELKARTKNPTYDQIRYWISTKSRLGLRAEFLTLQGEPFKRATFVYGNHIRVGGATLPFISQMKITDAQAPGEWSEITYRNPVEKDLPASLFNVNNLLR